MKNLSFKKIYRVIKYGLIQRNFKYFTSSIRVLPSFIIVGAVRCGTTSL